MGPLTPCSCPLCPAPSATWGLVQDLGPASSAHHLPQSTPAPPGPLLRVRTHLGCHGCPLSGSKVHEWLLSCPSPLDLLTLESEEVQQQHPDSTQGEGHPSPGTGTGYPGPRCAPLLQMRQHRVWGTLVGETVEVSQVVPVTPATPWLAFHTHHVWGTRALPPLHQEQLLPLPYRAASVQAAPDSSGDSMDSACCPHVRTVKSNDREACGSPLRAVPQHPIEPQHPTMPQHIPVPQHPTVSQHPTAPLPEKQPCVDIEEEVQWSTTKVQPETLRDNTMGPQCRQPKADSEWVVSQSVRPSLNKGGQPLRQALLRVLTLLHHSVEGGSNGAADAGQGATFSAVPDSDGEVHIEWLAGQQVTLCTIT